MIEFFFWTLTMLGLKPKPVHPSTLSHPRPPHHPRPVRFEQRARWNGYRFEEEGEPALLFPDDLEEGGRDLLGRLCLESSIQTPPRQIVVTKKKKKPYEPKVKPPVLIGGINEKGFGPPRHRL